MYFKQTPNRPARKLRRKPIPQANQPKGPPWYTVVFATSSSKIAWIWYV